MPLIVTGRRDEHDIALMGMFHMIMRYIPLQDVAEGAFTTQNHSLECFFFDRAHPALGIGVQIGRPRRQRHACDANGVDEPLKRRTEFAFAVVNQVLA